GGGSALVLAHQIPLLTMDIDGIPYQTDLGMADIDPYVKKVAKKLKLPADWLNTYFATFTFCLPKGYSDRLVSVFKGKKITTLALGCEDLLIMKCFAGREKDISHARLLLKQNLDLKLVVNHLHHCLNLKLPKAQEALDFFYDCCEQLGIDP
ncbi:MAG: DUF6036 family nucleotidyltransferase, partial [bacterium]|nr:DUF6036 family nucleotidyltransferase [bacterium]